MKLWNCTIELVWMALLLPIPLLHAQACILLTTESSEIGSGGLSGNPLKERSLEIIRYICKQSGNSIPVIGVGGILTPEDALDMIEAGASLVQVYTGFIYEGPFIVRRINKAIAKSLSGLRK